MGHQLKVVSYNIHRGLSPLRKMEVIHKLGQLLDDCGADIACLQEVWHARDMDDHQLAKLFDTWLHGVYRKTADFRKGRQGNAILSRFPIEFNAWYDISCVPRESRGLLHVKVTLPWLHRPLNVICTHLGLVQWERRAQINQIRAYLSEHVDVTEPIVLAGDFNDWLQELKVIEFRSRSLKDTYESLRGRFAKTYPSWYPLLSLDRVYFDGLSVISAGTVRPGYLKNLSDHLPLYAVFQGRSLAAKPGDLE